MAAREKQLQDALLAVLAAQDHPHELDAAVARAWAALGIRDAPPEARGNSTVPFVVQGRITHILRAGSLIELAELFQTFRPTAVRFDPVSRTLNVHDRDEQPIAMRSL